MNFFEQQDIAQSNTTKLVVLLFLAITALIVATTVLFAVVMYFLQTGNSAHYIETQGLSFWTNIRALISWQTFTSIGFTVICVVLIGSLFKFLQLSQGGRTVAESLGGRLINTRNKDADEKKVLNIVEEIAIASGTPVPPVYLLEDSSINAFAAGNSPQDAIIGVTRGCIQVLSREELQGVIAHEFSHIFHGDMRLNMRLVALLHGILILGLIGRFFTRHATFSRATRSSKNNGQFLFLGAGIGLMIIGYAGTFFGNLIKAAVSRQREFLADASAVQYTRNPMGISGALKKIGGFQGNSTLNSVQSTEFSHMYFSQGISTAFNALMATHPPLQTRIKRLEPNWNGEFLITTAPSHSELSAESVSSFSNNQHTAKAPIAPTSESSAENALSNIGQPNEAQLHSAADAIDALSDKLHEATHSSLGSCGILFGLLLDTKTQLYKQQWQALQKFYTAPELIAMKQTIIEAAGTPPQQRLLLIELSLPALKELSIAQIKILFTAMDELINTDNHVDLFEWSLRSIVRQHLQPEKPEKQSLPLSHLRESCQVLLSFLAHADENNGTTAQTAFQTAVDSLRFSSLKLLPKTQLNLNELEDSLRYLKRTKPLQKPQLLKAMIKCIEDKDTITPRKAELFRATASNLNCPIPPFTHQKTLST